jgi:hypothetical protein
LYTCADGLRNQFFSRYRRSANGNYLSATGRRQFTNQFANGTIAQHGQLAIEVRDDEPVERMAKIAHHDWKHSHPLDLSDEGLQTHLEEDGVDAENELAFEPDHKKQKKRDG